MTIRTITAIAATTAAAANAAVYNEAVDGDLSDDRFNPTLIGLDNGLNTVTMDVVNSNDTMSGDRDYFTISLAAGQTVSNVTLADLSLPNGGIDDTAFIGLGSGNFFDFDPDTNTGPGLIGFLLTGSSDVGTNIIAPLTAGGSDFGPGDFSFWVQQTGQDLTQISLGITVVPAPTTAALLTLGALATTRRRR